MRWNDFRTHSYHAKLQILPLRIHRREGTVVQWPMFISYTIIRVSSKYQMFWGMKSSVLWDVIPWCLVEVYWCFRRIYYPQFQILRVCWVCKQAGRSIHSACLADFLTPMIKAICSYKMSANFCYTRHVTFQKIALFIVTAVRFSSLTFWRTDTPQDNVKWW